MCNLGKIVYQTQMIRTQNVTLKHLYLQVLWGTSLEKTYLGHPKSSDLGATSTHWQKHDYPLEHNSHIHGNPPWIHVELIRGMVGTSTRFPSLCLEVNLVFDIIVVHPSLSTNLKIELFLDLLQSVLVVQ